MRARTRAPESRASAVLLRLLEQAALGHDWHRQHRLRGHRVSSDNSIRPIDIFRRVTSSRGQVFQRENMPVAALRGYDDISARAQDLIDSARRAVPGLPPIHFDYVINGKVNATAFLSDGQYFIALNTGTVYVITLIINRMLSDRTLFTWVGDPLREDEDLPPLEDYNPALPDADNLYLTNPLHVPRDSVRRAYAYFLRDQALMFIIGHEIAHITRGHVAYILKERLTPEYNENLWLPDDAMELRRERQAMEQDADGRSIGARINSLRDTFEADEYRSSPWASERDKYIGLFRDWSISANISFRLFADPSFSGPGSKPSLHAAPVFRWLVARAAAAYSVDQYWRPKLKEALLHGLDHGAAAVKHAFETILKDRVSIVQLDEPYIRSGLQHAKELHDYWYGTLTDKVRPYAFEPI